MDDTILACNRCGACCRIGGACIFRHWDQHDVEVKRPLEFTGTCDQLIDHEDGTTSCGVMLKCKPGDLAKYGNVVGECNFPDLIQDIIPLNLKPRNDHG